MAFVLSVGGVSRVTRRENHALGPRNGRLCMQGDGMEKKEVRSTGRAFANDFLEMVGRKGSGSDPGWDLRPIAKQGKGESVCSLCRGTGKTRCTQCSGLTIVKDGRKLPCPCCGGVSELVCSTCAGTGKQVSLVGEWWDWMQDFFLR
mmetsp:Transcript_15512/g.31384  ORF Transcript_15512/g.31384 Transcript_15512/m.31384 type:complete len:147 (+) Transcript_15512:115-555(+)